MNSIFTSPRGFPFDAKTLKEIQDLCIPPINGLASIMQDNSRLSGVVINNAADPATVNDGVIIWNKEILPFIGGTNTGQFSIMEEIEQRPFNVGTDIDPTIEDHPAYKRRWAQAGSLVGAISVHNMSLLKPIPKIVTHLGKGVVYLGTLVSGWGEQMGTIIPITFPTVGTVNYMILTSFYTVGSLTQPSFDFDIFDKTASGFKLRIKNVESPLLYVFFEYILIPSANQFEVTG